MTGGKDSDEIIFRKMRRKDIKIFVELFETCFSLESEIFGVDYQEVKELLGLRFLPFIGLLLKIGGIVAEFFVAETKDKVIGAASITGSRGNFEIGNVMTHPDYRGRGIGRKLFQMTVDEAKRKRLEKVFLEVRKDNLPAIRIYETEGFQTYEEKVTLRLELPFLEKETGEQRTEKVVFVKETKKIDRKNFSVYASDSYSPAYFKVHPSKKFNFGYSRRRLFFLRNFVGVKINQLVIRVKGDSTPKGYLLINGPQKGTYCSITNPIIQNEQVPLLKEAILDSIKILEKYNSKAITINIPTFREDIINVFEALGFERKICWVYMYKQLKDSKLG